MDYEMIKNDDTVQLKQMIIFLKAELIKYETMDSISEMNRLKQENRQLSVEKESLRKQLEKKEIPLDWTLVHQKLDVLTKMMQEHQKANQVVEQLTWEMKEKNQSIGELREENKVLSAKMQKISFEVVEQMDVEVKKVVQGAKDYRKQLDDKMETLKRMERELLDAIDAGKA